MAANNRAPAAPVPELPDAEVEAPEAKSRDGAVVLSGIDPRFDRLLVQQMREAAEYNALWLTASLSRISRHPGKLLQVVEYLLAHDVPILTANYLLQVSGIAGSHRAMAAKVVEQSNA